MSFKQPPALREWRIARFVQVWPAPDVMEFMGAKAQLRDDLRCLSSVASARSQDALCKIATLNIGLEDAAIYAGLQVQCVACVHSAVMTARRARSSEHDAEDTLAYYDPSVFAAGGRLSQPEKG